MQQNMHNGYPSLVVMFGSSAQVGVMQSPMTQTFAYGDYSLQHWNATIGAECPDQAACEATTAEENVGRLGPSALRRRRRQKAAAARAMVKTQVEEADASVKVSEPIIQCIPLDRQVSGLSDDSTNDSGSSRPPLSSQNSAESFGDDASCDSAPIIDDRDQVNESDHTALMLDLERAGTARANALASLSGRVRRLAFEAAGSRVVQQALVVCDRQSCKDIVAELHGSVREAIESPHANYVIQKIVEVVPSAFSAFVVEELLGTCSSVACHKFGCRVICRIIEYALADWHKVVDEVLDDVVKACRHPFGHYVLATLLEHGSPQQRQLVAAAIIHDVQRLARHRYGSRILEGLLTHGSVLCQQSVSSALIGSGSENIELLARHPFGSSVLLTLGDLPASTGLPQRTILFDKLHHMASQLQNEGKHARRLLRGLHIQTDS